MNEINYAHIIQEAIETPWAIMPQKLVVIREILILRASGGQLSDDEIKARLQAAEQASPSRQEASEDRVNVVVIPLVGTIVPRASLFSEISGAASLTHFRSSFRQALIDSDIDSIVIDIDSPGGQVGGVPEMADEIFEARGSKPIVAVANNLAASAAYWLGTAADELIVTPSGEVGSIGVFAMHEDISAHLDMLGVNISLVSAGKYKVEGNPFEALGEEARGAIQERVDDFYNMFTQAVARNRGTTNKDVQGGFGQGRVVGARQAAQMNMVDRIGTIDDGIQLAADLANPISARSFVVPDGVTTTGQGVSFVREDNTMTKKNDAIMLPDGTEMSVQELYDLKKAVETTRVELQAAKIEAVINEASDRGVSPVVIGLARQVMDQVSMDAEATLALEVEPGEAAKKVNFFGVISELLAMVPGRAGEITYAETGEQPPAEAPANPYRVQQAQTTEEAEAYAKRRRQELGLVRNGQNAEDIELG